MSERMVNGLADVPVEAVVSVESGGRTDRLTGRATLMEERLRFAFPERSFGCALAGIERVTTDSLPSSLADEFDDCVVVQWRGTDRRYRVAFERDSRTERLLMELYAAVLNGSETRVEQTTTPTEFDLGVEPRTETAATRLRVDPVTGVVGFDADGVEPIQPETVTNVGHSTVEIDGSERTVVQAEALTPERTTVTRVLSSSDRVAKVLRDQLVTAYRRTETGGPVRVLFVDDEPGIADVAKLHIRDEHPELSARFTTNTPRAVDLIQRKDFECVVTDYVMPEGGAPAILDAARAENASMAVVVFSRKDPDTLDGESTTDHVDAWIVKEMGTDQYHRIVQTVKRLVADRRAAD